MAGEFPFNHFLKNTKEDNSNIINNLAAEKFLNIENNEPKAEEMPSNDSAYDKSDLDLINKEILNLLRKSVNEQKFKTFFENALFLDSLGENSAVFKTSTAFIKNMLEEHHVSDIENAMFQTLGKPFKVTLQLMNSNGMDGLGSLTTPPLPETPAANPKSAKDVTFQLELTPTKKDLEAKIESQYIEHMNPEETGMVIDQAKTFDNFIVGPSNNMAFAVAVAVGNDPGSSGKYPSLYIHSNSGLGKTHLLHAVANKIREKYPHMTICLITARDFMKEMINAMRMKKIDEFQKKYLEKIDVLMIDDIHELNDKQGTQNEFFHIFNELYSKGKQLIFTSDKSPQEIAGIEERIRTRLQWGLVIDIQRPDLETRIAILKKKAYELDLYLPDDVLNLIASSVKSSIRELEGNLIRLSAFADVMKVEIDVDIVKDLLNLKDIDEDKKVTLDLIAKVTSQHYKVPVVDMKSKSRNKDITRARHVAIYLSRKILGSTQHQIAKFYGNRDHSSVIHATRTITKKLKTDRELSKDLITIESSL